MGFTVGEIFKGFFDKAPEIIHEAAQSLLGLASLSVLVSGAVGFFLFRDAAGKLKLLAFAMITGGLLGFSALVIVFAGNPSEKIAFKNKRKQNLPRGIA